MCTVLRVSTLCLPDVTSHHHMYWVLPGLFPFYCNLPKIGALSEISPPPLFNKVIAFLLKVYPPVYAAAHVVMQKKTPKSSTVERLTNQGRHHWVSLIAGMEYGMERWMHIVTANSCSCHCSSRLSSLLCVSRALVSSQRLYEQVQCLFSAFFFVWYHNVTVMQNLGPQRPAYSIMHRRPRSDQGLRCTDKDWSKETKERALISAIKHIQFVCKTAIIWQSTWWWATNVTMVWDIEPWQWAMLYLLIKLLR